jgi:hypothetical protein
MFLFGVKPHWDCSVAHEESRMRFEPGTFIEAGKRGPMSYATPLMSYVASLNELRHTPYELHSKIFTHNELRRTHK